MSKMNWWWRRFPLEQYYHWNSSVIYFEIFTISTSDCDISMRTDRLNWFFYTKQKINLLKSCNQGSLQKKKITQIGKPSLKQVGGQRHSPIKIIPEIGNTLVLIGGSSKKFPTKNYCIQCFFVGKNGVISHLNLPSLVCSVSFQILLLIRDSK